MKPTLNTILVTGATSGIGRAFAEALYDRGNRVLVTGRRQALLDSMSTFRPGLLGLALDLDDPGRRCAPVGLAARLRAGAQRGAGQRRHLAPGRHGFSRLECR
jgi:short-subunit dehydrogenase involved in D-alanine esterification of teichoic acids